MNYSKSSPDYIRVQLMVAAMDSLLTIEQGKRILKAAEWGGFDEAMKSLARVSDQIVKAQQKKAEDAAYNEGKIISLQSQVESEIEARILNGVRIWDGMNVYYTDVQRADAVNRLELRGLVAVDRSHPSYLSVSPMKEY